MGFCTKKGRDFFRVHSATFLGSLFWPCDSTPCCWKVLDLIPQARKPLVTVEDTCVPPDVEPWQPGWVRRASWVEFEFLEGPVSFSPPARWGLLDFLLFWNGFLFFLKPCKFNISLANGECDFFFPAGWVWISKRPWETPGFTGAGKAH